MSEMNPSVSETSLNRPGSPAGIDCAPDRPIRVKIITCSRAYNLGAVLQTYALQTYLLSQGLDAEVIDYNPDYFRNTVSYLAVGSYGRRNPAIRWLYRLYKLPRRFTDHRIYGRFRKRQLRTTAEYRSPEALETAGPAADVFICGSDQIWCPTKPTGRDRAMYLAFVKEGKKIAYAASFGEKTLTGGQIAFLRQHIAGFDRLSVRESSAVAVLNAAGFSGVQVADPVLLLSRNAWAAFSGGSRRHEKYGCYLLVYPMAVADPGFVIEAARTIAAEKNLTLVIVGKTKKGVGKNDRLVRDATPHDFVSLIAHASFVATNSFHATAFSVLFNKEFVVCGKEAEPNVRIDSLLRLAGLTDRYFRCGGERFAGRPVDYTAVNRRLDEHRVFSRRYLAEATGLAARRPAGNPERERTLSEQQRPAAGGLEKSRK